jgi:uncharacterized membrane protein YdjX (TVP38/TMEM64 family)
MSRIRRAFVLQLCGFVVLGIALALLARRFDLIQWLEQAQEQISQMGWRGAALYPFLLAACNLLLLPGGVLAMGAGLFFGLWWGFFLVLTGNLLGAAAAYFISRKIGRRWVEQKVFHHTKWGVLDEAIKREGWKIIFLSQVHPLFPTSLLNYLYGVTRIRFGVCMLWIALGQTPGLFLYSYLGTLTQLGIKLLRGRSNPESIEYFIWLGGLALTLAATFALGRIALRMLKEVEQTVRTQPDAAPETEN